LGLGGEKGNGVFSLQRGQGFCVRQEPVVAVLV
jgi:hypothetical protein